MNQPRQGYSARPIHWLLMALLLLSLALATPVAAQDAPAAGSEVTLDQVNEVARQLWCPLCSGVRLDTCDLKACDQMRQEIKLKLEAGADVETIKADFLAQYGPQILGEPPRSGFNWLAWILPIVALAGGAIFLLVRGRTLWQQPVATAAPAAPVNKEDEPYARQLEEELKRYG
jgi:cytochrome c-type biogenesis protein CcmH